MRVETWKCICNKKRNYIQEHKKIPFMNPTTDTLLLWPTNYEFDRVEQKLYLKTCHDTLQSLKRRFKDGLHRIKIRDLARAIPLCEDLTRIVLSFLLPRADYRLATQHSRLKCC
jgi:hypothetical protein